MTRDGRGIDDRLVSGDARAPAQVEVVAHRDEARIEQTDFLDQLARDEQRGARGVENFLDLLVLALIDFSAFDARDGAAVSVGGLAEILKQQRIIPFEQLRADDAGSRRLHRPHHRLHSTGPQRSIVVEDQERVGVEPTLRRDLQAGSERAPVPDAALEGNDPPHAEGLREDRAGTVGRRVVDGEDLDRPILLGAQSFEDFGQPCGPIGRDEQYQYRWVIGELHEPREPTKRPPRPANSSDFWAVRREGQELHEAPK